MGMSALITGFKTNGTQQETKNERPKAQFWLNVGIKVGDKLVSLPMGIPLDSLEPKEIPGPSTKNVEFRQLRQAEHVLWQQVQELMSTLKPGQSVTIADFTCEIRRTEDKSNVDTTPDSDNPFLAALKLTVK